MVAAGLSETLARRLEDLPSRPGCYLFRGKPDPSKPDVPGEVLYVGKAKSLRARVRSYFQASSSDERWQLPHLQRTIADLDTVVTASEKEALILENSLIKEHKPRFNVKLRDDKDYLSIRISLRDAWPRIYVVRRPEPDGSKYFGPYHSATAARRKTAGGALVLRGLRLLADRGRGAARGRRGTHR